MYAQIKTSHLIFLARKYPTKILFISMRFGSRNLHKPVSIRTQQNSVFHWFIIDYVLIKRPLYNSSCVGDMWALRLKNESVNTPFVQSVRLILSCQLPVIQ